MWNFLKTKSAFQSGMEYALSEMAKHGDSCVDRLLAESDNPFEYSGFDRGIRNVVKNSLPLKQEEAICYFTKGIS